jgi:hypothetical protein
VELLADNVLLCRQRLFDLWNQAYEKAVKSRDRKEAVRESAQYILEKNIIRGNALSLHQVDEEGKDTPAPIIFSQWAFVTGPMMKREDYTFEQLLTREQEQLPQPAKKQLDLGFEAPSPKKEDEGQLIKVYPPIQYWRLKEYE